MSCLTGFLLHNVRFLPDKPHQTWHPSLARKTGFQQRRIIQSTSRVKGGLFSTRLATASGSWSVSCLSSVARQKGKAVITNKLLLVKLSLTMQSDQCVAPSWNRANINRTVTTKLRSLCLLRVQFDIPSSHLFSCSHTPYDVQLSTSKPWLDDIFVTFLSELCGPGLF